MALEMGWPNVDGMLETIPARLWPEWVAFYELEPFGPLQEDVRHGQLTTLMANAYRKKNARLHKMTDFYPHLKEVERPKSTKAKWMEAKTWAMRWNAALKARPGKEKKD